MIELVNVRKVFNAGNPSEFSAINNVSLHIAGNKVTVLKGPSGSGKTTLLSIVGCMSRPSAGRVKLNEREITSLPERFLTDIRRTTFGFIFQQPNLIKGISVLENVMLPAYPLGEKRATLKVKAMNGLDKLNLSSKAASKVEWLSGGEAQRVAIVRALINDPQIIIADEPTAHLDTKLSYRFMEIVDQFKAQGKTVIITSHDPLVYDSNIVDDVVNLRDGKLEDKPA
ncbi:putative ABC transporter ATP-binding protein YknY [Methylococcales bacterium]|nr:putative ABC transporter ATP-binding protein YknY [Methylococcales bacterium]